jgi:hypothetical protein
MVTGASAGPRDMTGSMVTVMGWAEHAETHSVTVRAIPLSARLTDLPRDGASHVVRFV